MVSTYSTSNKLDKPAKGDDVDTWATTVWEPFVDSVDDALDGVMSYTNLTGNDTLTTTDGVVNEARNRIIWVKAADGNYTITIPAVPKWYFVINDDANNTVTLDSGGVTVAVGPKCRAILFCDGTDVISMHTNGWKYVGSTAANTGTEISVTLPSGQHNEFMLIGEGISHSAGSSYYLLFGDGSNSAGESGLAHAAAATVSFTCHIQAGMWNGTSRYARFNIAQSSSAITAGDWLSGTGEVAVLNSKSFNDTFRLGWWNGVGSATFDGAGTILLFAR